MNHVSIIIQQLLGIDRLANMPYDEYMKSPEWITKRKKALTKAGYRCSKCHTQNYLNVHHKTYERRGHERQEDLVVLCRKCHEKAHGL